MADVEKKVKKTKKQTKGSAADGKSMKKKPSKSDLNDDGGKKPKLKKDKSKSSLNGDSETPKKLKKDKSKSSLNGDAKETKKKVKKDKTDEKKRRRSSTKVAVESKPEDGLPVMTQSMSVKASGLSKRLGGGLNFAALDAQAKKDKKKADKKSNPLKGQEHSRIYQALNPQALWKETKDERKHKNDDENVIVVDVRGGSGMGVLMAEDSQLVVDDNGNVVDVGYTLPMRGDEGEEYDESEEDFDENDLADFDDDTMQELARKRKEREAEEERHREELKQKAAEEKAARERELEEQWKEIEAKEAAIKAASPDNITDEDVKEVQSRLEKELDFGDEFGFK